MFLPWTAPVWAAAPAQNSGPRGEAALHLDPAAVTTFANRQIPAAMRAGRIPGAVFAVVKSERVVFQKGYGFADVQSREPVSPTNTLFRVASLSKIFTAAAALQLVQEHLLNLNRNVNRYLAGFHITPAYGKPITLFDLLTHSSGFDVYWLDYAARTAAQKMPLRNYLIRFQPARIRPPGLFSGYDNYGYSLAGYLVQKVSGVPFARYEDRRLLEPLDMRHSSFSPDPALRKALATGYWLDGGTRRPYPQTCVNITPAAGLCSTAADMSHFLVALLANRRPDGLRAFSRFVMGGLLTQQFSFNPEIPGRCFGFDEVTVTGRRALRQTGQWPGFNALLLLFPRQHCGLFLAYNLCDQLQMGRRIARGFAERFVPLKPDPVDPRTAPDPAPAALARLCGAYLSVRYPQDSPNLGEPRELDVTQARDGQLKMGGRCYHEIAPLVFEASGAPNAGTTADKRVAFRIGRDGNVADLITESGAFYRVNWTDSRQGRLWLTGAAMLILLSAVILWPIMLLVRFLSTHTILRAARSPASTGSRGTFSKFARGTAFATCLLAVWFEGALVWTEFQLDPFADIYGLPRPIRLLFELMPVMMFLCAVLVVFSIVIWRRRLWHVAHRLHYTLIPVALLVLFYIYHCQHLLFIV